MLWKDSLTSKAWAGSKTDRANRANRQDQTMSALPPENAPETISLAPFWVGAAIFLLPPLGIFLLWRHPVLGRSEGWKKAAYAWGGIWLIAQVSNAFRDDSKTPRPESAGTPQSVPASGSSSGVGISGRSPDYIRSWEEGHRVGQHWASQLRSHSGKHPAMIAQIEESIDTVAANYDSMLRMVISNGITTGPAFDRCQGHVDGFQAGLHE